MTTTHQPEMHQPEMSDTEDSDVEMNDLGTQDNDRERLFSNDDSESFERRWTEVQTHFVDNPKRAVEDADSLVAEVMERLTSRFTDQKCLLDEQWSSGDETETEDLRLAMTRYREFFRRLLAA